MSGADKGGASDHAGKRPPARKRPASETARQDTSSVSEEEQVEAPREVPAPRTPTLVLIVEDEAPIAEALSLIVADAGYSPLVARHGMEALELARARKPALVITDLMMPRMDGAGLIAALHAEASTNGADPAPPIVLMTAANLQLAREAGADAVLRKPFDISDVEKLLRQFLDSSA